MAYILAVFIPGPIGHFRQGVRAGIPHGKPNRTGRVRGHAGALGGKRKKRQEEKHCDTKKTLANIYLHK
jgi:hypothetical protein